MGIYFNPDNEAFANAVNSRIYIDKTGLIDFLNNVVMTEDRCVAVSHARRFGKSQAARMIDAYYSKGSNSAELFSKFEIAKSPEFKKYLNKYNVIHLDISSFADFYTDDLTEKITERLYREFMLECTGKEYEGISYSEPINLVIAQIYKASKTPFVIIIDEWDCIIRNQSGRPDLVHKYLQFLHSLFKSEESCGFLALAYVTGILPIKKIGDESALNNFREYTMLSSKQLTPYFGFTEDEVKALCEKHGMNFDSIKNWYDGYLISGQHMYNPNSVYQAMIDRSLESYWKNTSAFDTINNYITLNFDGLKEDTLKMLSGVPVKVDTRGFKNDLAVINSRDDALTALIHLGYLGYNEERHTAFIPNYEVSTAFQAAISTGNWSKVSETVSACDELLWATIDGDAEKVAELVALAHEAYTSILKYNDENSLSCAVTMAYFTAPAYYNIIREFPTGKGYADLAFIPRTDSGNKPAMIIELKWNRSADTAIRQIKERRYVGRLSGYGKKILLVGISYDKDSPDKRHVCTIEPWSDVSK